MNTVQTKRLGSIIFIFNFILMMTTVIACGPMNGDKKTNGATDGATLPGAPGSAGTIKSAKATADNKYYVYVNSVDPNSTVARVPSEGENTFLIRCVHSSDLSSVLSDFKLIATYEMPEMPGMGQMDETATRQADGSYRVMLVFSMKGTWRVTLKMQDGSVQDTYVFETNI